MARRHTRVLSLNGGGIRGYIPGVILDKISRDSGKRVDQLFDIIIGTSIGGLLSAAYTTPLDINNPSLGPKFNTTEILNLMIQSRNNIFPQNQKRNQLLSAKYPRDGLDQLLQQAFTNNGTDVLLKDTILPIAVTSLNELNNHPQIWTSCSKEFSNYSLANAVGATTAAPTYFPAKEIKSQNNISTSECSNYGMLQKNDGCYYKLIDGGIFANSPAMLALQILRNRIVGNTIMECTPYLILVSQNEIN